MNEKLKESSNYIFSQKFINNFEIEIISLIFTQFETIKTPLIAKDRHFKRIDISKLMLKFCWLHIFASKYNKFVSKCHLI